MVDLAAKSVKLIPCYTFTAVMKGIFHTMYDRKPRGIRTLFLSINYTALPVSISICHRHKSDKLGPHLHCVCLCDMFALPLSFMKCLYTLENEKEAL